MKRKRSNSYYVEPFSIGRNAWPLTGKEILRMIRYMGIACWVTAVVVREMFAYLHPDSTAATLVPFFVFILLIVPTLHVIHRLLRPSATEIGLRWDYIVSHPLEHPGEAAAGIAD